MSAVRPRVLIVLFASVMAGVAYAPRLVTGSHLGAPRAEPKAPQVDLNRTSLTSADETDPDAQDLPDAVDLYGNEVTDAVAKYQLDASGMLYELHSPQTEVPRPKPPKT